METKIQAIYGENSTFVMQGINKLIEKYKDIKTSQKQWVTENEIMLITYGDSIINKNQNKNENKKQLPLNTLNQFISEHMENSLTVIHILPCFPYTSDDGFSVVDYLEIDSSLGNWEDIKLLSQNSDLMLDAVINHVSVKSKWFTEFLAGNEKYEKYFIVADPTLDYSKVTRPRMLPLLTEFETKTGKKHVWTTFSDDQIDLNFENPELLIEILNVLATYAKNGARFIRLDAIGFMFKKAGTTCLHLEETHMLVQIMREFLDLVAPNTILISETNVPHIDNISYFGQGNEAHMVYQFPLPPLTLFSFYTQSAKKLMDWANSLEQPMENTTYFNFLASHDGIGMRPTEGLLTKDEQQMMVDKVIANGGFVSYKDNGDGTKSPYELNSNYMDALSDKSVSDEVRAQKLLAAHAILFSFVGVPGVYVHSLLGSRNDREAAISSQINRRINREKLDIESLTNELQTNYIRKTVFTEMKSLMKTRRKQSAFSPVATQKILHLDERIFSILRRNETTKQEILVLVNVSCDNIALNIQTKGFDLISRKEVSSACEIKPFGYMWIVLS